MKSNKINENSNMTTMFRWNDPDEANADRVKTSALGGSVLFCLDKTPKCRKDSSVIGSSGTVSTKSVSGRDDDDDIVCKNSFTCVCRSKRTRSMRSLILLLLVVCIVVCSSLSLILRYIHDKGILSSSKLSSLLNSSNSSTLVTTTNSSLLSLSSSSSSLSRPPLQYVPIKPFFACNGNIEKVVCNTTLLFEFANVVPLPQVRDPRVKTKICEHLLKGEKEQHIVTVPICVQNHNSLGVLIQYDKTKVIDGGATTSRSLRTNNKPLEQMELERRIRRQLRQQQQQNVLLARPVEQMNNEKVQNWLRSLRLADSSSTTIVMDGSDDPSNNDIVRIVPLKRVDFPRHYRYVSMRDEVERFRDDNYGNMVWRYAATELLNQATVHTRTMNYWNSWYLYADEFECPVNESTIEPVDAVVIATANTFHITPEPYLQSTIEAMTRRVRDRNVSTVVIGLGIQMEFDNKETEDEDKSNTTNVTTSKMTMALNRTDVTLPHQFQVDLLREVSKHQTIPAIGLRGDLTLSVCQNAGIENCVSMGCPSLTLSRDMNLGQTLQQQWDANLVSIRSPHSTDGKRNSMNIALALPALSSSSSNKPAYSAMELFAHILEQYNKKNGDRVSIIQQSAHDAVRFKNFLHNQWNVSHPLSPLLLDIDNPTSYDYVEYNNVESWIDDAAMYDLCISARIHGAMTFIAAGVPAIVVPTDFRIMELIMSMRVPFISPFDVNGIIQSQQKQQHQAIAQSDTTTTTSTSTVNNQNDVDRTKSIIESIMEHAQNVDFTNFEINRRNKIKGWKTILQDGAGLEIDPALLRIIQSPTPLSI